MEPQVGEIWTSTESWHVLLLEELDKNDFGPAWFSVLYLEDGLITNARIDLFWQKVA
jgi:hypothetical protein